MVTEIRVVSHIEFIYSASVYGVPTFFPTPLIGSPDRSKGVCLGLQPVWVKTKINCKLAKAAHKHARFSPFCRGMHGVFGLGAHRPILSLFSKLLMEKQDRPMCGHCGLGAGQMWVFPVTTCSDVPSTRGPRAGAGWTTGRHAPPCSLPSHHTSCWTSK